MATVGVVMLVLFAVMIAVWISSANRAKDLAQQARDAEQQARSAAEAMAGLSRATTPAIQPALAAWKQGDQGGAVSNFIAADWSAGPIFAPESMLSLTESWFLSQMRPVPGVGVTGEVRSEQMMKELRTVKELVAAVTHAGLDAAATGKVALAGKHFASLQQFGAALDQPNSLSILRLEGRAIQVKAGAELQKIPAEAVAPKITTSQTAPEATQPAAIPDPLAAIELKVAQQQLEKTLADLQTAQTERALLPSKPGLSDAEQKAEAMHLERKLQVLEQHAAQLRTRIQQSAKP